ncbi:sigma-24, ECF subfamily [Candidatus Koribacter versatilis Ellin345]|uniref:Sigma-24, ECF subfamily n=1 Tax=Koribacter versatilis (strain Ellin345) TaxID=204669 RepID=Q1IV01_KORVE|nr:sigma-70 family RNA polymerase sigma factor [Candidatus Koribacter versatilis]ABF39299.1 sigma-24, ECF subfamily [Candidatus Koribacter versatilis Ellin345]
MIEDFEQVYKKHSASVFRLALRCVGRRDIAEEITSEAFLALYKNFAKIDTTQLPAWLFTVAKRRAADYWRRMPHDQTSLDDIDPAAPHKEPQLGLNDLFRKCSSLTPLHRVCVTLRYVHGLTRAEIAAKLGLSETQVKGHLQYALHLLRTALTGGKEPAHATTDE